MSNDTAPLARYDECDAQPRFSSFEKPDHFDALLDKYYNFIADGKLADSFDFDFELYDSYGLTTTDDGHVKFAYDDLSGDGRRRPTRCRARFG